MGHGAASFLKSEALELEGAEAAVLLQLWIGSLVILGVVRQIQYK